MNASVSGELCDSEATTHSPSSASENSGLFYDTTGERYTRIRSGATSRGVLIQKLNKDGLGTEPKELAKVAQRGGGTAR